MNLDRLTRDEIILIGEMRAVAIILEKVNRVYNYSVNAGSWSPRTLRYEADYLEKNGGDAA